MRSAPTDCRVPDPTDAKADGQFVNRRAGYGDQRLAAIENWARCGWTLSAGEGAVLCDEMDRLRRILAALREPSAAVVQAMQQQTYFTLDNDVRLGFRAAVAAAEQEVGV